MEATRALVALHSSDPITPHLGMWARVPGFATTALEHALVTSRTLWRLHAMRRTLFVVASDEAAMFEAGASRDVALKERKRLEKWVAPEIGKRSVPRWIAKLEQRVLDALSDGSERRTNELTEMIPELATQILLGSGKWSARAPLSSRLLFVMAMDGRIVRTAAAGSWRSSQYAWARASSWFDAEHLTQRDAAHGRIDLVRRYLAAFGPVTVADIRWWTGFTAKHVAQALDEIGTTSVELEGGEPALVLAGDVEAVHVPRGQVALLPSLDATAMGWKERQWYLGPHAPVLFDRNGNVGPTVWLDGRIVGGWAQHASGEVVFRVLEPVNKADGRRIVKEAKLLTEWLKGVVVTPRFRTPLERELCAAEAGFVAAKP